eukprot:CCRYP_000744-RF/>CCRYP_000744-RF protein AED:0.48 eAED:0.48 QI:0/0/0/1/0/0/2/0/182
MTYNDFVSLLRCVAGPIILADQYDTPGKDDESLTHSPEQTHLVSTTVLLSSSVQAKKATRPYPEIRDTVSHCRKRETECPVCEVGGYPLNSISMYMQKVPLEERMYNLAEQGRVRVCRNRKLGRIRQVTRFVDQGSIPKVVSQIQILLFGIHWSAPASHIAFGYANTPTPIKDGSQCSFIRF